MDIKNSLFLFSLIQKIYNVKGIQNDTWALSNVTHDTNTEKTFRQY